MSNFASFLVATSPEIKFDDVDRTTTRPKLRKALMASIRIDEKNLEEIERLLGQSLNGLHLLFENKKVAEVLKHPTESLDFFSIENQDRIQVLFTSLVQHESYFDKLCFLRELDEESYEILLRTYFHILDNTVMATTPDRH
jgi:hypothetical protein